MSERAHQREERAGRRIKSGEIFRPVRDGRDGPEVVSRGAVAHRRGHPAREGPGVVGCLAGGRGRTSTAPTASMLAARRI